MRSTHPWRPRSIDVQKPKSAPCMTRACMGISQHLKTTSPTCLVHVLVGSFGYHVSHMGIWVVLVRVLLESRLFSTLGWHFDHLFLQDGKCVYFLLFQYVSWSVLTQWTASCYLIWSEGWTLNIVVYIYTGFLRCPVFHIQSERIKQTTKCKTMQRWNHTHLATSTNPYYWVIPTWLIVSQLSKSTELCVEKKLART